MLRRMKEMNMTGFSLEMNTSHIWLQGKGHGQRRKNGFFYYTRMEEMTRDKAPHKENTLAWGLGGLRYPDLLSSLFLSAHIAIQCLSKPIQVLTLPLHWSAEYKNLEMCFSVLWFDMRLNLNTYCALSVLINVPFTAWLIHLSLQNSVDFIPAFLFPLLNALQ